MTTEDSTEKIPDVIYPHPETAKELRIPVMLNPKYYSQAELDRRVAEAEERQRERCAEAYLSQNRIGQMVPSVIANAIRNAGGQGDE